MVQKHYEWKIGETPPKIGEHSRSKHRILDRYLRRYIEICTTTPVQEKLNISIVDGYSGGGKYLFNEQQIDGSPLILLNAVAEMQDKLNRERPKGFEIQTDFLFVDQNKNHTDYLRSEIEKSPFADQLDQSIQIWNNDFNLVVEDAIKLAKRRSPMRGRSLFILDQYGWSSVAFKSIRSILKDLEKAEIFLTFNVDGLIDYMSTKRLEQNGYKQIDVDPGFIRELLSSKEESAAWRALIQNSLYKHIKSETSATYYSPFFIRSPDAHRSYWFIHLSRHREARNEIGNIHWQENNISLHHGRAGLQSLGFSRGADPSQLLLGYEFDDHARNSSKHTLMEQIPRIIRNAIDADLAPSLEQLFGHECNDTPVTRELFEEALIELRMLGEVHIEDAYGKDKPRAQTVNWSDRIILSRQRNFFGPFGSMGEKS